MGANWNATQMLRTPSRDVVWLAHASRGANRDRNRSTVHWIATGLAFTRLQQGGRIQAPTLSAALVGAWLLSFAAARDRKEPTTPPQTTTFFADRRRSQHVRKSTRQPPAQSYILS